MDDCATMAWSRQKRLLVARSKIFIILYFLLHLFLLWIVLWMLDVGYLYRFQLLWVFIQMAGQKGWNGTALYSKLESPANGHCLLVCIYKLNATYRLTTVFRNTFWFHCRRLHGECAMYDVWCATLQFFIFFLSLKLFPFLMALSQLIRQVQKQLCQFV